MAQFIIKDNKVIYGDIELALVNVRDLVSIRGTQQRIEMFPDSCPGLMSLFFELQDCRIFRSIDELNFVAKMHQNTISRFRTDYLDNELTYSEINLLASTLLQANVSKILLKDSQQKLFLDSYYKYLKLIGISLECSGYGHLDLSSSLQLVISTSLSFMGPTAATLKAKNGGVYFVHKTGSVPVANQVVTVNLDNLPFDALRTEKGVYPVKLYLPASAENCNLLVNIDPTNPSTAPLYLRRFAVYGQILTPCINAAINTFCQYHSYELAESVFMAIFRRCLTVLEINHDAAISYIIKKSLTYLKGILV